MNYKKLVEIIGSDGQIKKTLEEILELAGNLIKTQTKEFTEEERIKIIKDIIMETAHVQMVLKSLKIVFNMKESDINKEIHKKENILIKKYPQLIEDEYKKQMENDDRQLAYNFMMLPYITRASILYKFTLFTFCETDHSKVLEQIFEKIKEQGNFEYFKTEVKEQLKNVRGI